ncbi:hypothetical protein BUPH_08365 (plasmid) [Paraburkholderia phenoliruptrix BR3459a]|uniref:Uncharacterized protein n=1 Tax=Paraburkholderia phenoliruptrix BR3459a TaxID=1229205 RepID=K0E385_9BURK|nr:hypothetical protein BUPH_08365 [Paraburkholderia phenoliruptrix BR3459a]
MYGQCGAARQRCQNNDAKLRPRDRNGRVGGFTATLPDGAGNGWMGRDLVHGVRLARMFRSAGGEGRPCLADATTGSTMLLFYLSAVGEQGS